MPAVNRYYSSVAVDTTLSFSISSTDLTIVVGSTAGFPTSYPYTLALGYDLSNEELVTIVGASGTTLTIGLTASGGANVAGRGVDGTNDQDHVAGEPVKHVISARDMTEAQAHIAGEADVHGLATAGPSGASGGTVVGTTASQTLTNKTITGGTVNATTLQQGGIPAVTTTGTQTLTNKTIDSASNTLTVAQSAVTNLTSDLALKAPLANPTFTGTVTLPTGAVTSGMIADGTIVNADINSSAAIDWTKLAISSTVSSTEIGYVDGVTSAIQPQIDGKSGTAHTHAYLPSSGGTLTGDLVSSGVGQFTTNTAAGRGVLIAQPSGDTQPAILQFTNNAGSAQRGSITASAGGTITINPATDTTINGNLNVTSIVDAYYYYSDVGFQTTGGTIETLGNGPIKTTGVEMTGAIIRPTTGNTGAVGGSANRFNTIYLVNQPNVSSDQRNKSEVAESELGLDFINNLNPVSYKLLVDEENRTHYGLIAQEVKQAVDNSGVADFAGWVGEDEDDPESRQSLAYGEFTAPMIKAIQELCAEVQTLKAKVAELEAK
jgi:hypothetical protein